MPIIECIDLVFPDKHVHYSMPEIVSRLQMMYSEHLSRTSIYNAHKALKESPATAELVAPLDADASEKLYSVAAARRIARRVIGGRTPAQIAPRVLPIRALSSTSQNIGTEMGRNWDESGNLRLASSKTL